MEMVSQNVLYLLLAAKRARRGPVTGGPQTLTFAKTKKNHGLLIRCDGLGHALHQAHPRRAAHISFPLRQSSLSILALLFANVVELEL